MVGKVAGVDLWVAPDLEQVRRAAFLRWLRRGGGHGQDRDDWLAAQLELTFSQNYEVIVEYPLDAPGTFVVSDRRVRYCRFCERTAAQVAFGLPMPLLGGGWSPSLETAAVCSECRRVFRDAQSAALERFREALAEDALSEPGGESPRAVECYT